MEGMILTTPVYMMINEPILGEVFRQYSAEKKSASKLQLYIHIVEMIMSVQIHKDLKIRM